MSDFEALRNGTASAAETEAIGLHLAQCDACAEAAQSSLGVADSVTAFQAAFDDEDEMFAEHPDQADLEAIAEGLFVSSEVTDHVKQCRACGEDVDDLRQWIDRLHRPRRRYKLAAATIAAAAAIVIIAFLNRSGGEQTAVVRPMRPVATQPPAAAAAPRASTTRPPEWDAFVARVRSTKTLPFPDEIRELSGHDTFRGGRESTASGELWPAGTAVLEARPLFRWTAEAGARYEVIVTAGDNEVTRSGALSSPSWRCNVALSPEVAYGWELHVERNGRHSLLPAPPAPPAIFRVVSAKERTAIEQARRDAPDDHLLLGLLYSRAGVVDEARRELKASHDPLASALLRQFPSAR